MNRERIGRFLEIATELARESLLDLARNRWLVLVSLIAGVVLWALIQDVENPRLEARVPADNYQPIPVEPVNLPDGLVIGEPESLSVRVRVKASEDDIPGLTSDDFRATIDVQGLVPGETVPLPVDVESNHSNVRVVAVEPDTFSVTLEEATSRELQVTVKLLGELPVGFRIPEGSTAEADPQIAIVTGRAELVDSVASVEIELNLTGVREETHSFEGELVARTAGGNRVDVQIIPARARASVDVEQILAQRTVAVRPLVRGSPAPGYHVTAITIEPLVVTATGPTEIIESLLEFTAEVVDVSGAQTTVTRNRDISPAPNVSTDVSTVLVEVTIEPLQCGPATSGPCGGQTWSIGPDFEDLPDGLVVDGDYAVELRLSGPLDELALLTLFDIEVVVSLAGVLPGLNIVEPTAEIVGRGFDGVSIDEVEPLPIRIVSVPGATSTPTRTPVQTPTPSATSVPGQ